MSNHSTVQQAQRRTFVTAELDAASTARLVSGAVVPRPIAWVGTVDSCGTPNLAPFSFYNAVSTRPPRLMFSTSLRAGTEKDTLTNLRQVPEFTVSLATDALAEQLNATSLELPPDSDEFQIAGVAPEYSLTCAAPGVAASPVIMECLVDRFVDLSEDNPHDGYVVTIGAITRFRLDEAFIDDEGRIDQAAIIAIARMGGPTYSRATDLFDMPRPTGGNRG